jgi:hypothetical protein
MSLKDKNDDKNLLLNFKQKGMINEKSADQELASGSKSKILEAILDKVDNDKGGPKTAYVRGHGSQVFHRHYSR